MISDKLDYLNETKAQIKQAIIDKGQEVSDETPFREYVQKIQDIKTSEDLNEVLQAQDNIIAEQQEQINTLLNSLNNKTQGLAKPNIFVQEEEPATKEGIWIQKSGVINNIIPDEEVFINGEWEPDGKYTSIPYDFYEGSATIIKNNVYLFGGYSSQSSAYKYNILTDTYTRLTDIPYNFYEGSVTSVGTNIYLFGGSGSGNGIRCYKYDTLTDTYTQLTNIPYSFQSSNVITIGSDIYLFGSGIATYTKYAYKYDTLTDTYTKLTNIPYKFYNGGVASVGSGIYLFGAGDTTSSKYTYKYDTLTDTYTKLANIPYGFYYGSVVSIGSDIYLFGHGSTSYWNYTYKYDTLTDTYTRLADIPYPFYFGSAINIDDTQVLLFGGSNSLKKVQSYRTSDKDYSNNSVVIYQGKYNNSKYNSQIFNNSLINGRLLYSFYNAWHYTTENKLDKISPTYYGDGTQWIKFKN